MKRRNFIGGCAVCAALGAAPFLTMRGFAAQQEHSSWSYDGATGPAHWGETGPENLACSAGTQQSPVDIQNSISAELAPITVRWPVAEGTMVNNGHSIQIDMPSGFTLLRGDDTYQMVQFHFHAPSEHQVEGKTYPMEAHFVHKNTKNGSYGVLAVFLTPGKANPAFAELASLFPRQSGAKVAVKKANPLGLLPSSLDYWLYKGSLTTPPCSENVDWMILQQPLEVSAEDIAAFTDIYPNDARPIERLNRRFILSSQ